MVLIGVFKILCTGGSRCEDEPQLDTLSGSCCGYALWNDDVGLMWYKRNEDEEAESLAGFFLATLLEATLLNSGPDAVRGGFCKLTLAADKK